MPMPELPQLNCTYGAPMGRREYREIPADMQVKFYLQYVPFVDGAYDRGGAYWGCPANLYTAYACIEMEGEQLETRLFIRANSRDDAKRQVLEEYELAQFYR